MKKFTFNREAYMSSTSYGISKKILNIPQWVLMIIAAVMSVTSGVLQTKLSAIIKSVTEGNTDLMNVMVMYIIITVGISLISFISGNALKAYRLNEVNSEFMKRYHKVFESRTQDISAVGPAKIESTINQIACYRSDIKVYVIGIVRLVVPFGITMWKVMELNLIAGLLMMAIMVVTTILSVSGDKLFHFSETASNMKGDMRSVSVNNFMVVRMLKYMGAKAYAMKRQNTAQQEATPAFLNITQRVYSTIVNILFNTPVLIALGVAAINGDIGLAVFIALNEWSIYSMVDYTSAITELMTEIQGLEKVIDCLKGDDTDITEKPAMPEKMILKDVEFYYASDKDHRTAFKIPYFEIEKGKRYRFAAASGLGKSSYFRYFAGEMEANRAFNVRTFYIHQRTELLHDTVRNNITLGNPYVPDPVIYELIREMKLDNWFNTLEKGLDTIIGGQIEPSGGEASRISLMRLFIHIRNYTVNGSQPNHNDVLILDEVTSALDKRDVFVRDDELSTEEAVIKVIDRETKGCTMFVISHEDASSNAFGFKDIVDQQMIIRINSDNSRELVKMADVDVTPIMMSKVV